MQAFYFGCRQGPGHFFHDASGSRWHQSLEAEGNPWGYTVDGGLQPKGIDQKEGVAALHHKDGWTALAFWDRSQDQRGGCCSVFLCDQLLTFSEMLDMARQKFPWKTFPFEITEYQPAIAPVVQPQTQL